MKIERKIFYTMRKENGVIGLLQKDGYQCSVSGNVFHMYTENGIVWFIDPYTGNALFAVDGREEEGYDTELNIVKRAAEIFAQSHVADVLGTKRNQMSYRCLKQAFDSLKNAIGYYEEYKDHLVKENHNG